MQVFDASSILSAWDNYPIDQFPPLWDWMAGLVDSEEIQIPRVAFDEINHKSPDCGDWLRAHSVKLIDVDNAIAGQAMSIKGALGIANDEYHAKGVDENDILIISTAKVHRAGLVSDEGRQQRNPTELKKHKIPAVCDLPGVGVDCQNFLEFMKKSGRVFR